MCVCACARASFVCSDLIDVREVVLGLEYCLSCGSPASDNLSTAAVFLPVLATLLSMAYRYPMSHLPTQPNRDNGKLLVNPQSN